MVAGKILKQFKGGARSSIKIQAIKDNDGRVKVGLFFEISEALLELIRAESLMKVGQYEPKGLYLLLEPLVILARLDLGNIS
jgi:hypothetical protein